MGDSVEEEPEWKKTLPPGYMFAPFDKEIFKCYLLPKVKGEYFHPQVIPEFDIYQCQPSQLPGLDPKQAFSYFFTKTDKKHQNGKRLNRFTKDKKGHWRITSKIQEVTEEDGKTVIGRKNVLVYMYENKIKTNWIMHEYMLDHNYANKNEGDKLDTSVVVCRIYERKGKNNCENNSDESEVIRDVEQKHKRGSSSSSQSDDPGESSSRDKRWKQHCINNQTSLNSNPLDVQPAATMMMQTTYWEEQPLQPLSDHKLASNNNGCYPFDVQLNSMPQQPATYRDELQLPNFDPMKKLIPQPPKEPNLNVEEKEDDDSDFDFDTDSFFL
ncbi:NAC domain-containing protein 96-like [Ipomoea triloba]|uniref:NAC domain-containing protein 96-like n=1 Tax=Ipomoea triloba TaxID=35885 RepID=UPI00125E5D7B|nr:NAC domain-containing protein 96-like [Ipomoea triloba]